MVYWKNAPGEVPHLRALDFDVAEQKPLVPAFEAGLDQKVGVAVWLPAVSGDFAGTAGSICLIRIPGLYWEQIEIEDWL